MRELCNKNKGKSAVSGVLSKEHKDPELFLWGPRGFVCDSKNKEEAENEPLTFYPYLKLQNTGLL